MSKFAHTLSYQAATAHGPQQQPGSYRHLHLTPLSGAMGAEVEGIELAGASDEAITEVERALTDHLALLVRDQDLSPAQQVAFARRLGRPVPWPYAEPMPGYPELTELRTEPGNVYNFGGQWHSDSCSYERPPKYTMLYAVEVPAVGGDTSFANQYLAWETLDPALKTELETLRAVHSSELGFATEETNEAVQAVRGTQVVYRPELFSEVLHPVARTHPVTGRKALYVNDTYTLCFEGRTQEESLPLLKQLWAHSALPEFTCRFRWRQGSLAIWDNRCCLHYAHNDYPGQRRVMRRLVIEGERPV